jgi:hypothetical protein
MELASRRTNSIPRSCFPAYEEPRSTAERRASVKSVSLLRRFLLLIELSMTAALSMDAAA